jgi:phospholipid/cholesterol/gamma-HCH transport system substrate-binding protein
MADQPKNTPPPAPTSPPQPETSVQKSEPTARHLPVRNLELKAILLLAFTVALVVASGLFVMRARGYFDPKQHLVLLADNAEGVVAGMDLTFSGFPIGTVKKVSLGEKGNVRIDIDVIEKDAKWLRTSSVFTLIKPIFGPAQLRAYTGVLTDPALQEGDERPVLRGDFNEEVGRVIGATKDVLDNLNQFTAQNSELNRSMANLQVFTEKLQSRQGALGAIFGNEQDARKLLQAVERADAAMARVDTFVAHADNRVFGRSGLADDAQATIRQVNTLLSDARGSLQRLDAVLKDAQGIAGNVNKATEDLGSLRGDVEANLRKIEDLINDLNRKWPFAKDRKIELP